MVNADGIASLNWAHIVVVVLVALWMAYHS